MHVPSQPSMRSLLSQSQTPTASSQKSVGFFGFGCSSGCPFQANHPAYFGSATFYFRQSFQPSTRANLNTWFNIVNAPFQCKPNFQEQSGMDRNPLNYQCLMSGKLHSSHFSTVSFTGRDI